MKFYHFFDDLVPDLTDLALGFDFYDYVSLGTYYYYYYYCKSFCFFIL